MKQELETILYSISDGVALVQLNRPDRMNTLGGSMKDDLDTIFFKILRNNQTVRCVILTGTGERAFCAGADIKERAANRPHPPEYFINQQKTHDLFRRIETFERPVIAAINGVALGGGLELALCADIRIAAEHARLGLTEVNLGVLPAAGGTQRLPRLIGESRAKELIFTGQMIDAYEAQDIGLVSSVTAAEKLIEEAQALAEIIASKPPLSVTFAKNAINTGMQVGIDAGLEYERYAASMLIDSEDRKEGMQAFLEKRKPEFKGR